MREQAWGLKVVMTRDKGEATAKNSLACSLREVMKTAKCMFSFGQNPFI